ncbi:nuclear transport factor 2 family protein [Lujinxingia vulgaris]|uniref:Nuclear transport factor 2 family protein n=1 Tax=Lujinxingia vulgaris TaxID=2600176 RepID=A0A5C6XMI9_9DELT|nr:nuclear transport factor 2 family protein [Lujinxingia vulgaris]TXD44594.1 nuclear transport factor 2 family protein [Lujinxingia vulgaris]
MPTDLHALLSALNYALAGGDFEYILEHAADDIRWEIVGVMVIEGKDALAQAFEVFAQSETRGMELRSIFASHDEGVVHGTMRVATASGEERSYAFCDVYRFELADASTPLLQHLTSYIVMPQTGALTELLGEGTPPDEG